MGKYADIKIRKLKNVLSWLRNKPGVEISSGGKHQVMVKCIYNNEKYPLPQHRVINGYIVEGLMKKLVAWGVCSKEEFEERIK